MEAQKKKKNRMLNRWILRMKGFWMIRFKKNLKTKIIVKLTLVYFFLFFYKFNYLEEKLLKDKIVFVTKLLAMSKEKRKNHELLVSNSK